MTPPIPRSRVVIPAALVLLLIAAATRDHYFRDEFYYLACSRRMAWGYVDQPPLSIAILWLVVHVAGQSLLAIRAAAAMVFGLTVALTGRLARRLGAGGFGEVLAMVGMAIAPALLATGGYFSMNVIDVLLWTMAISVFIEAVDGTGDRVPRDGTWALLGMLLGLGLLNKISVLWLGAGFGAALILTPARATLRTRGPYLAAAIAGVLFLPHVLWQMAHGWPTLEFIHNASSDKMQRNTPLSFLADQVMNLHPLTLPIWGGGLLALLASTRLRRYRALAIVWLTVAVILIVNRTSRSGYLVAAYPMLFAAGGVFYESLIRSRVARSLVIAILIAGGAATLPLAVPVLSTDAYVRYSRALGVAPSTEEKKEVGRLPQGFADRQGWDALVDQVAAAWNRLTPSERAGAAVLTGNYGEAGAIETLGASRGLVAISGHNNYWLWGPEGRTGATLIVLSRSPQRLRTRWDHVEAAGETSCGDCMPYENHLPIWICRGPHESLAQRWPQLKHYD